MMGQLIAHSADSTEEWIESMLLQRPRDANANKNLNN